MKKYDSIIFDFDGVLVKSKRIKELSFKKIYEPYGVSDKVDIQKGGKSRYEKFKYFHKKLLGKELTKREIKNFAEQYSHVTKEAVIKCPWVDGAESFIKNNYMEIDLYIVSGTPQKELDDIIKQRKIAKFFKGIHGAYDEKYNIIAKIVSKNGYKHTVYIGDELSDYINAKKAGIDFIGKITPDEENIFKGKHMATISNIKELEQLLKI